MSSSTLAQTLLDEPELVAGYIGFPIPELCFTRMELLVQNLRDNVPEHQGRLYSQVVLDLVDESLATFFIGPMDDIGISPMGEKVVRAGVTSVKKAVGVLVSTLGKKLTNKERMPLAEYLWGVVYIDEDKDDPRQNAYMASPINSALDRDLTQIILDIEAGETGASIEERLIATLLNVSDIALYIFFAKPLELLQLGLVMRKASQMAYEGTRAAIRGVIKKVFKGMGEQELRGVAKYIRQVRFSQERFQVVGDRVAEDLT